MQLVVSLLAVATFTENRSGKRIAAWKAAYARWADERIIAQAALRMSLLSPHYLDDIGLAHRALHLPDPTPQDLRHHDSHGLPLFPRA